MEREITRIEKEKYYKADNGKIGIFKGKWKIDIWGIEYALEDTEGNIIGYIKQKNVKNGIIDSADIGNDDK